MYQSDIWRISMAIKNKTKYAILGVLSSRSCSGYDIKKFCDRGISHFWNENFGHIYPVLDQLVNEGLIIENDDISDGKRKVYSITQEGRDGFIEWLSQPVDYQPVRSELLLKLSFAGNIPVDKAIEIIQQAKDKRLLMLKEYQKVEKDFLSQHKPGKEEVYPFWFATLRYGIISSEATIKWCEEIIDSLKQYRRNR
jgi:PadR family transcriptional regulator, regulatory protein AphA